MHLYTCDFESLYTNIKAEHAVTAISLHILRHTNLLQQFQMSIIGFRKILDLIFTCNIFKYDKILSFVKRYLKVLVHREASHVCTWTTK